jgi:hypothetical protein
VRTLPTTMIRVLDPFAPLFSKRVCQHVRVLLLVGAFPQPRAKGPRTLPYVRRGSGPREAIPSLPDRVFSHASWSSREASRVLLRLLVRTFSPEEPLVLGIDETLERCWEKKIRASPAPQTGQMGRPRLKCERAYRTSRWSPKILPPSGGLSRLPTGTVIKGSAAGVGGALNRDGLLCGVMAKVELKNVRKES